MAVRVTRLNPGMGSKVRYEKFTVDYATIAAIIGAAVSGNVSLFTLPQRGVIMYAFVHCTTQFAGVAGTLKVSVGDAGSATKFTAASADFVATQTDQETTVMKQETADTAVLLNVVSSSGNLSGLSAGSVDIYLLYVPVPALYLPGDSATNVA